MNDATNPNTRKYLFYPLAILMISLSLPQLLRLAILITGEGLIPDDRTFVSMSLIILGALVGCGGIFLDRKKWAFAGILIFGCAPIVNFLFTTFNLLPQNANPSPIPFTTLWSFISLFQSIVFLTAIFVLFPYRKYFFSNAEKTYGIISLLGTMFLLQGLLRIIFHLSLGGDYVFHSFYISLLAILTGIGMLIGEGVMGIIGFLLYLFLYLSDAIEVIRYFPDFQNLPIVNKIILAENNWNFLFYGAILIMLLTIYRHQFHVGRFFKAIFKEGYGGARTASKRCSRCNRTVPMSSRAGQSCPHCGAYWSSEQQIGF